MKRSLLLSMVCIPVLAFAQPANPQSAAEDSARAADPPMLGIHWARGFDPAFRAHESHTSKSPLMTYHGGEVLTTVTAHSIFWGTTWRAYTGDKITGLDTWYHGFGSSTYAKASDEYSGSNGQVTSTVNFIGHTIDATAAAAGGSTSAILAEVCKVVGTSAVHNGYYPVYVDLPRGHAGYCGYHSSGVCNGVTVQFAFFWNLDGDPGCDPGDTSGLHSEGLAAVSNTSAHELSEARTDPASPGAWYDSSGQENGDKCNFIFADPLVTFTNGSQWKVQAEWSNNAYTLNNGFPNSSGQHGCID